MVTSRTGDSDHIVEATSMNDLASNFSRGSSGQIRAVTGNWWVALQIVLVSLLVVLAGTGCEDAEPDAPAGLPLATSTPVEAVKPVQTESSGDAGTGTPDDLSVATTTPAGSVEPVNTAGPADGVWLLELLDGQPIIEEKVVTLRINGDRIEGIDGCNRYSGPVYAGPKEDRTPVAGTPVASADGGFSAPPLLRTQKGCYLTDHANPDVIVDQADAYISALTQGVRYRLVGDRLEILDGEGVVRLVFVSKALPGQPADLRGTSWRLITDDDVDNDQRATTLTFNGRMVIGSTACRDYLAWYSYTKSEGSMGFSRTSMLGSDDSCSESSRRLEREYRSFLGRAWEYSVHEEQGTSRLRISDSQGNSLTFEPLEPLIDDPSSR